jgi:hypothetical protein
VLRSGLQTSASQSLCNCHGGALLSWKSQLLAGTSLCFLGGEIAAILTCCRASCSGRHGCDHDGQHDEAIRHSRHIWCNDERFHQRQRAALHLQGPPSDRLLARHRNQEQGAAAAAAGPRAGVDQEQDHFISLYRDPAGRVEEGVRQGPKKIACDEQVMLERGLCRELGMCTSVREYWSSRIQSHDEAHRLPSTSHLTGSTGRLP